MFYINYTTRRLLSLSGFEATKKFKLIKIDPEQIYDDSSHPSQEKNTKKNNNEIKFWIIDGAIQIEMNTNLRIDTLDYLASISEKRNGEINT